LDDIGFAPDPQNIFMGEKTPAPAIFMLHIRDDVLSDPPKKSGPANTSELYGFVRPEEFVAV
jgi:hypothetical protein